jgi:predicted small lipoprotein YifL
MPRARTLLAVLLGAACALAGCGNKGQLVLPDQQPKKHKSSKAPAKTPASKPADSAPPNGGADPGH